MSMSMSPATKGWQPTPAVTDYVGKGRVAACCARRLR